MSFESQTKEIKKICGDIIAGGEVKTVLAFTTDKDTGYSAPFFVKKSEDIEAIVWNDKCTPNLAKYLLERKERTAILAKPCDVRAIVMYMVEKQIERDDVYIIGVECPGMKGKNGLTAGWCAECTVRIPPEYDVIVKEDRNNMAAENSGNKTSVNVKEIDEKNNENKSGGKLARLKNELRKCILCYSCRQACYGCYCKSCFMEKNIPDWQPPDLNMGSKMVYHLGRAMHLAGRCVECGSCERACPSGVDIRYLIREITDFCKDEYGCKAGMDPAETPVLASFDPDDRETGFLKV